MLTRLGLLIAATCFACGVDDPTELSTFEGAVDIVGPTLPPGTPVPCSPTDGRIDAMTLASAPPAFAGAPSGLLTRTAIHYLAGGRLDIALTIPDCTAVVRVLKDGVELPYDPDTVDMPPAYWEHRDTVDVDATRQRQTIRLHVENDGTGDTSSIQVVVGPIWGTAATASRSFTLALVNRIGSQTRPLTTSIGPNSFRNLLIEAIFNMFGESDETFFEKSDGSEQRLYAPSYAPSVTLTSSGVQLSWSVWADVPGCDQRITFGGTFSLVPDVDHLEVVWGGDGLPTASFATAPFPDCLISTSPGAEDVLQARQMFREIFQNVITEKTTKLGLEAIVAVDHDPNQIKLQFVGIEVPSVFVKVPYLSWANAVHASPFANGMAINVNEDVMLFPANVASVCRDQPAYMNQCNGVLLDPAGGPNAAANPPLVDEMHPAPLTGHRAEAAAEMLKLTRPASAVIPMVDHNIGMLTARISTSLFGTSAYKKAGDSLGAPCKLRADAIGKLAAFQHRLVLATNDPFSQFLWNHSSSQSFEVGVGFFGGVAAGSNEALVLAATDPCE